jgi:outer membrane receptor protein involved in Fe transport
MRGQSNPRRQPRALLGALALSCAQMSAQAQAQPAAPADSGTAPRVEVTGHYDNTVGSADAASAGTITPQLIEDRPLQRPGSLLEYIPGMVVTQHSGAGKANQYFLRGFNLDHGTDFATWVAGMPVNLRTHAHGQGYTDLSFVIPELISRVDYWKGPYYAEIGDFGSAGGAKMHYSTRLKQGIALGTLGDHGYQRALLAGSPQAGPGVATYALEYEHDDGPWDVPMNFKKWNGLLRYTVPLGEGTLGLTAMGYSGTWDSTDQVAQRAVDSGLIGRFGTLDASSGGESSRYSLSADLAAPLAGGDVKSTAYWFKYRLNLYSNFTYFLSDPVNGDQFEQADDRNVYGWTGQWSKAAELFGYPSRYAVGLELRQDRIKPVGLHATRSRQRLSSTREDDVVESSAGLFVSNETQWSDAFRSVLGLRYDRYRFEVDALSNPQNSGEVSSGITSPKMSLIFGPWNKTEYFVNAGHGFHSNDARGVTIRVDPVGGDPADAATPLVRSKGAELGLRTEAVQNVQSSLALWVLKLDSELVFVGDAGATEAGRPSERYGLEWSTRWRPQPWMFVDLDVAWNHARFTGNAPEGNHVPGAPDAVVSAGVAVDRYGPWSGSVFLRYIGAYPLTEDNSVRSDAQTTVDAQVGYELLRDLRLRVDVFNLFDAKNNDITYYYESRLTGEPAAGVADKHIHPAQPRSIRVSLSYRF